MGVLHPTFLEGVDETLAWRVIAIARSIAPCVDSVEGDDFDAVVAILKGVAAEASTRGSRQIAKQRIGPASVDYRGDSDWFSPEDRTALRAICNRTSAAAVGPVGSFPAPSRVVDHLWPDDRHC